MLYLVKPEHRGSKGEMVKIMEHDIEPGILSFCVEIVTYTIVLHCLYHYGVGCLKKAST